MKKIFVCLLVIGVLVASIPFDVSATMSAYVPRTADSTEDLGDGTVRKKYSVYVNTTDNEPVNTTEFTFSFGSAITSSWCHAGGDFVVNDQPSEKGANPRKCKFVYNGNEENATGEKILVGTLEVVVKKNSNEDDCKIHYQWGETEADVIINPETGAIIPYKVIVGGMALAACLYFMTNKKTKMYKV